MGILNKLPRIDGSQTYNRFTKRKQEDETGDLQVQSQPDIIVRPCLKRFDPKALTEVLSFTIEFVGL